MRSPSWLHPVFMTFAGATVVALLAIPTLAKDWPQWRGPTRDGISRESDLLKK